MGTTGVGYGVGVASLSAEDEEQPTVEIKMLAKTSKMIKYCLRGFFIRFPISLIVFVFCGLSFEIRLANLIAHLPWRTVPPPPFYWGVPGKPARMPDVGLILFSNTFRHSLKYTKYTIRYGKNRSL